MMNILLTILMLTPLCVSGGIYMLVLLLMLSMMIPMDSSWMYDYYWNLSYSLGSDLLSMSLIMLSFWIILLMFVASKNIYTSLYNYKYFMGLCLALMMIPLGTFMCMKMFVFYLWLEFSLIPTLFLVFA